MSAKAKPSEPAPANEFIKSRVDVNFILKLEAEAVGVPVTPQLLAQWEAFNELRVAKVWRNIARDFLKLVKESP